MMATIIDLRSDTVTKPTDEMREAMLRAEVGDDVYGEDPTVTQIQEMAAEMLGKEAALFVTSGTQGNQVAIAAQAGRGEEIIAEAESHIFYYEAGAVAAIAGAQLRQLPGTRGSLLPESVEAAVRPLDIHQPPTRLICLENTHNRAGGAILPLAHLQGVAKVAERYGISVHMDGARLFNAAVALGIPIREIAQYADTVQVCLSKGLAAPIGSIVAGSTKFIEEARVWRKRLGGGMRQAGVIAAPGMIALQTMVERLAVDHENAKRLANGLKNLPGLRVDVESVETNIVLVQVEEHFPISAEELIRKLAALGVRVSQFGAQTIRMVTHKDVLEEDIEDVIERVTNCLGAISP
ncbi:L-threonine aldolase [Alicyclobacillus tolerans]|uniref:L-threonine aldolase n=2 Tax=Alicyclobacillus tolerans TaxID=90970 RepID=A0A1M6K1M7_9BACL|nr:L-threonine aldolase [Alicyclobacillus montanus]